MPRLPKNNLNFAAHLTVGQRCGTCFFMPFEGSLYLVTAHHVLFKKFSPIPRHYSAHVLTYSGPGGSRADEPMHFDLDLATLQHAGHVQTSPIHDVCTIRLGEAQLEDGLEHGVVRWFQGVSGMNDSTLQLMCVIETMYRSFNDVEIGNDVVVFGYPTSLNLVPQAQYDFSRPLLRSGIVAGKYKERKTILIDVAVYPGNSGGPVIELEASNPFEQRYHVIGVVTQLVPAHAEVGQILVPSADDSGSSSSADTVADVEMKPKIVAHTNSGYAVVASIDSVLELLKSPVVELGDHRPISTSDIVSNDRSHDGSDPDDGKVSAH